MENYLLASFGFVQLGNRTSKPLTITFDGKQWTLPPYPAVCQAPIAVARAACRQFPLMGSEDPYSPADCQLIVYVREWMPHEPGMLDTPIEQSDKCERLDRSMLPRELQNVEQLNFRRAPDRGAERMPAAQVEGRSGSAAFFESE
jgi:hypothetical protein